MTPYEGGRISHRREAALIDRRLPPEMRLSWICRSILNSILRLPLVCGSFRPVRCFVKRTNSFAKLVVVCRKRRKGGLPLTSVSRITTDQSLRMKIKRLPNVLALHLKRFKYQENLGRYVKLSYRVPFPTQLRLPNTSDDAEDPDRLYELFAVVVHIGK